MSNQKVRGLTEDDEQSAGTGEAAGLGRLGTKATLDDGGSGLMRAARRAKRIKKGFPGGIASRQHCCRADRQDADFLVGLFWQLDSRTRGLLTGAADISDDARPENPSEIHILFS